MNCQFQLRHRIIACALISLVQSESIIKKAAAQCDSWQALGSGMDDRVFALAVYNNELIAGGAFFSPGGTMGHIARWNGAIWQPLGLGIDSAVQALAVYNGELIAGGAFGFPGGVAANHVARWNGTTWAPLGDGLSGGVVNALAVFNGELIAAGDFTSFGSVAVNRIARWNGTDWRPLGNGLNDRVNALAVYNGNLIAGGWFWLSGMTPVSSLAQWNGAKWRDVGAGTNGVVNALVEFKGALIVGGSFTTVGWGNPYPLIAAWHGGDGTSWSALGGGVDGEVAAVVPFREELIAGGEFAHADGASANNVASWLGESWHPLGSGTDGKIWSLAVYNGDLYAGGTFTTANNLVRNHIARWQRCYRCPGDVNGNDTVNVTDLLAVINAWGNCPVSPTNCSADMAPDGGDGQVSVTDLLAVINAWGPCPTGACWLPSNTCILNTKAECYAALGLGWVRGATCIDNDSDRIPDAFELNDCSGPALPFVGTDPAIADTDGDSIKDGDEFYGTAAGLNLPAMGANPLHKTILIETDWILHPGNGANKNRLHPTQRARVQEAFANSPVGNHCWGTGVTLLIDYGQGGVFTGGNQIADPDGDGMIDVSNFTLDGSEFGAIKAAPANFAVNRNGYFHYCLMCDAYSIAGSYQNSSGLAEINGDDFIVAFGQWAFGDDNKIGNTIMHEFGHNLNLRHGGNEDRNFKPNYNSIMNYWYQMCGTDLDNDAQSDDFLDYSHGDNVGYPLNESDLDESKGVTGTGPPINWNQTGGDTEVGVHRNINCRVTNTFANSNCAAGFMMQSEMCNVFGQCFDNSCDTLRDFNDWAGLQFGGISDGDLVPHEIMHCWLEDNEIRRRDMPHTGEPHH